MSEPTDTPVAKVSPETTTANPSSGQSSHPVGGQVRRASLGNGNILTAQYCPPEPAVDGSEVGNFISSDSKLHKVFTSGMLSLHSMLYLSVPFI